jgi:hypothetical protein
MRREGAQTICSSVCIASPKTYKRQMDGMEWKWSFMLSDESIYGGLSLGNTDAHGQYLFIPPVSIN